MTGRRWVIVLRGIEDATPAQLELAAARARTALGLEHGGTVTVQEWMFDEVTSNEFRPERNPA